MHRRGYHRAAVFLPGILVLAGCNRTLVFGEETGFNMGIFVKPNESTPLQVNFGLDRKVASIVPPKTEPGPQGANGEAVNMFAGFRAAYDTVQKDNVVQPFAGSLRIRTQFASGAAAKAIAADPNTVARVVDVSNSISMPGSLMRDEATKNRADVEQRIKLLAGAQQVRLANNMIPKLSTRPADFQAAMRALVPKTGQFGSSVQQQQPQSGSIWIGRTTSLT
jgi:hypothetical protein